MHTIERLPTSEYMPAKSIAYVDVYKLQELYSALAFRSHLILAGPKGVGKSLSVQAFAAANQIPIITFDCSEDVRRSHLLGQFVMRGNETPFVLGPLTTAFEIANETKKCILAFEEINALSPQMQKVLNGATDFRRRIDLPEALRVFRLAHDAQLWITGTMNFTAYGGVYELNEDLKSRFQMISLEYPSLESEQRIIDELFLSRIRGDRSLSTATIESVLRLAQETRQAGALEYALSTRDVVQILENITRIGLQKALWLATGKFEGDDKTTIRARIKDIFPGVEI